MLRLNMWLRKSQREKLKAKVKGEGQTKVQKAKVEKMVQLRYISGLRTNIIITKGKQS